MYYVAIFFNKMGGMWPQQVTKVLEDGHGQHLSMNLKVGDRKRRRNEKLYTERVLH